ncbi:helix-turn-helix domain-containing protein [Puniceibacterium sediminis]|uniref:Transcriptional regulator, AraC family n=1 Tax=Puniceibacterium sediminis TaxID=1608407 RepID=A0A238VZT2_9RHOB|nr:helix-turn-helix domain-containing protein [Puniceibacterium sediminis]SNR39855.1 transcriptional regulator, AraC family [Puniceibacterium sediminis]
MTQRPAFLSRSRMNESAQPDSRNIRCQSLAQYAQGAPWRLTHLHDLQRNLLVWITRGQGRVIVNGVRRGVGTHNALFLPAGTLFAIDLGAQGFAQVVESPAGLTGRLPQTSVHLRVRDSLAQAELTAEMEAMQRELSRERPLMQDALEAHVGLIAVWIARQQATGSSDIPRDTAAQRLVRQFSRLVVRDFRTDRPMADYATALDVTPTHLSRVCRECCGKTAADMLTERRLNEARVLLATPDPTIQDVARNLGFNSPAYFTRFIQTHTGKTPSALRKLSLGTSTR